MPFDDFLSQFSDMSICRVINTSVFTFTKTWHENQQFGAWKTGPGREDRSGGCPNYPETVLNNPQFRFDIDDEKEEVIIQLSQQDRRSKVLRSRPSFVGHFPTLQLGLHFRRTIES